MSEESDFSLSYRIRAEELRAIADMDRSKQTRDTLMEIARDYDRIAESFDAIERSKRWLRQSTSAKDG